MDGNRLNNAWEVYSQMLLCDWNSHRQESHPKGPEEDEQSREQSGKGTAQENS